MSVAALRICVWGLLFIYLLWCRDSLSAQLDLTVTKAESEQLARALQEEQYFELSQESKKATARHKQEIGEREATIAQVSLTWNTSVTSFTSVALTLVTRRDQNDCFQNCVQLEESNKTLTKDVDHLSKNNTELSEKLRLQEEGTVFCWICPCCFVMMSSCCGPFTV